MIKCIICLAVLLAGASVSRSQELPAQERLFNIPRVGDAIFDGKQTNLGNRGLEVRTLCCAYGMPWPKATPAPTLRIAWNENGLIVAVAVHHAHPCEADYLRHLFKGDSVEVFVSPRKGSRDRYMLIISPGLDPRYPVSRHCFFADPSEEGEKDLSDLTFQSAIARTADGYQMEVLLPWSNLHLQPQAGMELALQTYIMQAEPQSAPTVAMWNPAGESYVDPRSTQRICLADKPDAPVLASGTIQDDTEHAARTVHIVAPAEFAGKQFDVLCPDDGVIYGTLALSRTQSAASLSLSPGQACQIFIDGVPVPITLVPPADDPATILTQKLKCRFRCAVFAGTQFPRPYVEGAPHYRVTHVTYFDANLHAVVSALSPGRYGAVVEIADGKSRISRRFRTLFRVPDSLGPWRANANDLAELPALLARDARAIDRAPLDTAGNRDLSFLNQADALVNPDTAALAACLFEHPGIPSQADPIIDFRCLDRQWWVDLKRKLNDWDEQFPSPFLCPTPMIASAGTIVRAGTDEEAGVKRDKVETIDRICRSIVADTGEPVSICLVRHGIVFFHHAYGDIKGRPFTNDDPGDIKSATKPLAGALMMEVVDRGLVQLNQPIDKIFPSFRGIPVKRAMVLGDLFDHLCGLVGDWGDQIPDTEEIIAGYYPSIDVGNYSYNEVGFALSGKVLEAVSGESFPAFAKHHLLDPLGMAQTRVTNAGGHNATTSLDYATFGQLLLNRGAYGNLRFFSEATFKQMLPSTDAATGGIRRGIGLMWMPWQKFGFAPGTFGHNAGNSSVLGIDPVHDLVVVIVSAGERKDFDGRAGPFYRAVVDALK